MKVSLALIAGARPNFMKIAPLVHALSRDPDFDPILVHTGQHYDDNMSGQFFRDLDIPPPRYHLEVGSGSHAQQTAEIMKRLEPVLLETKPAGLIVVGDVNSTVAGALVASKLGIQVVHVEAGLRSFDRSMPEEINRIVTDSISGLLLITEESARVNLLREGINPQRIHAVGNLMIDSLKKNLARALQSNVRERLALPQRYGLVTLHRPANVDDSRQLGEILGALEMIAGELPLLWPMHPRTKARIESNGVHLPPQLRFSDPQGYLDFLCLQANSAVVLTDSGGIQEETTVLGVPCLTLRVNTERPVTVDHGTNRLAGTSKQSILAAWESSKVDPRTGLQPPLWDGLAGLRCRDVLRQFFLGSEPAARQTVSTV